MACVITGCWFYIPPPNEPLSAEVPNTSQSGWRWIILSGETWIKKKRERWIMKRQQTMAMIQSLRGGARSPQEVQSHISQPRTRKRLDAPESSPWQRGRPQLLICRAGPETSERNVLSFQVPLQRHRSWPPREDRNTFVFPLRRCTSPWGFLNILHSQRAQRNTPWVMNFNGGCAVCRCNGYQLNAAPCSEKQRWIAQTSHLRIRGWSLLIFRENRINSGELFV